MQSVCADDEVSEQASGSLNAVPASSDGIVRESIGGCLPRYRLQLVIDADTPFFKVHMNRALIHHGMSA